MATYTYVDGTGIHTYVLTAPELTLGGGGGSKPRPTEGKMWPRGTGKG